MMSLFGGDVLVPSKESVFKFHVVLEEFSD